MDVTKQGNGDDTPRDRPRTKARLRRTLLFVRFGGLSSVVQKGYRADMPGFHSPPARRGIYAFVLQTIEPFLLNLTEFDPRRMRWTDACETEQGWRIKQFPDRHGDLRTAEVVDPKVFPYDGGIWHHLPVPRSKLIREHGSWRLTTTATHRTAFWREYRRRIYNDKVNSAQHRNYFINPFLLDHFEVFIEKV